MRTYILTLALGIAILAISYSCRTTDSILQYSNNAKRTIALLLPQGWAFFTKSARDPNFFVFEVQNDNSVQRTSIPNTCLENWLGLSRYSRRVSYESSILLSQASNPSWTEKKGLQFPKIDSLRSHYIFSENPAIKNIKPGKYLIYKEEPIPWAWKKSFDMNNARRSYLLIDLTICEN